MKRSFLSPRRGRVSDPTKPVEYDYARQWKGYQYICGGISLFFGVLLWVGILVDTFVSDKYALIQGDSIIPGMVYAGGMFVVLISQMLYTFFALSGMDSTTSDFEFTCLQALMGVVAGFCMDGALHFLLSTHPANTIVPVLLIFDTVIWSGYLYMWCIDYYSTPATSTPIVKYAQH